MQRETTSGECLDGFTELSRDAESSPLVESDDSVDFNTFAPSLCLTSSKMIACMTLAAFTAALSGLAALSDSTESGAGTLQTPQELLNLLSEASWQASVFGGIAFTCTEVVLTYLNNRFFFPSFMAAIDLVIRTFQGLGHLFFCTLSSAEKWLPLELALFIWSILTSFIFAEIVAKAFSFAAPYGEAVAFIAGLLVYFTTRFFGAKLFFKNTADVNWRLKQSHLKRLELLADSTVDITEPLPEGAGTDALIRYLNGVTDRWQVLSNNNSYRILFLQYLAPSLGGLLVLATAPPIMLGLIPQAVAGLENITCVVKCADLGESANYQNNFSFTFGAFATALTLLFYELNIFYLPKDFFKTAFTTYEKAQASDRDAVIKLVLFTIAAFFGSYFTSIGFRFVTETAYENGYFSYLGAFSSWIPRGIQAAIITMLWANLQALINQASFSQTDVTTGNIEKVQRAKKSLSDSSLVLTDTNLEALHTHSAFNGCRRDVEASPVDIQTTSEDKPCGWLSKLATCFGST